jgi:CCR4-NOT transcription complex subunit 1
VENVVSALQRAKESGDQHDHEFLACFLHGLFDEHRFFNTYPAVQLTLTACLFGDLIQYQLIDFIPLGIAVRYVLDALRNPPDSNWFSFGIQALARFQSRLSEWPQLAHSILSIAHLQQSHPDVANFARAALQAREGGGNTNGNGNDHHGELPESNELALALEPLHEEMERPAFTAIHVDLTGEEEPEAPDEETTDKILFIVNNLAPSNFETKVDEMSARMEPAHFAWFAHYIVAQRVSIEPNNHQLYLKFLDALAKPLLIKRVLYETFVKLATLLNSEKTVQSSTERTLLKNLGSWLGGLTLAKNKPIKQQNIAFKDLLIQGYDSNRLIVAIPFVCKVLEQCSKSRVFKPPNPWLMAILRLLVELYQFAELKLNLKFEIEVLCKSLNVDLKEVEPTDLLRNRSKEVAAVLELAATAQEVEERNRNFAAGGGGGDQNRLLPPTSALAGQAGYSLSIQGSSRCGLVASLIRLTLEQWPY